MGLGIFGSSSESDQRTYNTTQSWSNSNNSALTSARTYENVGNPTLSIGLPGTGGETSTEKLLTLGLGVILLLFGVRALLKSG